MKNRLIFTLTLVLFIPFAIILFSQDYVPVTDEAYQLQAATRFARGEGVTSNFGTNPFINRGYQYLYQWPPGYSILIGSLAKTGISLNTIASLVKLLTIFAGLFLWLKLASIYLNSPSGKLIFMSLCSIVIFSYIFLHTDIIVWALYPYYSFLMLFLASSGVMSSKSSADIPTVKNNIFPFVKIGLVLSLLILFKFSTVVLMPITFCWFILLYGGNLYKLISRLLVSLSPPTVTYFVINYINLRFSGFLSNSLDYANFDLKRFLHFQVIIQKIYIFFEYFYVRPFRLDILTRQIATITHLNSNLLLMVITVLALLVSFYFIIRLFRNTNNQHIKMLTLWLGVNIVVYIIFYFFIYGLSPNSTISWPFSRSRYHLGVITLLMLVLIYAIQHLSRSKIVKAFSDKYFALSIYISVFAIMTSASFISVKKAFAKYNSEKSILRRNITHFQEVNGVNFVIADKPYNGMLIYDDYIPSFKPQLFKKIVDANEFDKPFLVISPPSKGLSNFYLPEGLYHSYSEKIVIENFVYYYFK